MIVPIEISGSDSSFLRPSSSFVIGNPDEPKPAVRRAHARSIENLSGKGGWTAPDIAARAQ
jgi:hypothetical protein